MLMWLMSIQIYIENGTQLDEWLMIPMALNQNQNRIAPHDKYLKEKKIFRIDGIS